MTQAELAHHLAEYGMRTHPTSIAKIEAGTRGVTVDELVAMGEALGWGETFLENLLLTYSSDDRTAISAGEALDATWVDLISAVQKHAQAREAVVAVLKSFDVSDRVRERVQQKLDVETLDDAVAAADVDERGISRIIDGLDQEAP